MKPQKVYEPDTQAFRLLCHDMYARFGAVFKALRPLCATQAEQQVLADELHRLRTAVRQLLEEARDA